MTKLNDFKDKIIKHIRYDKVNDEHFISTHDLKTHFNKKEVEIIYDLLDEYNKGLRALNTSHYDY